MAINIYQKTERGKFSCGRFLSYCDMVDSRICVTCPTEREWKS